MATNPTKVAAVSERAKEIEQQAPPPANAGTAMYARMTATAATQAVLTEAAVRVLRAKTEVERLSNAILLEQAKAIGLKADRTFAVDEMEAALQAHDTAVRADQAARAVPVAG